jgi:hypothetical protein
MGQSSAVSRHHEQSGEPVLLSLVWALDVGIARVGVRGGIVFLVLLKQA